MNTPTYIVQQESTTTETLKTFLLDLTEIMSQEGDDTNSRDYLFWVLNAVKEHALDIQTTLIDTEEAWQQFKAFKGIY